MFSEEQISVLESMGFERNGLMMTHKNKMICVDIVNEEIFTNDELYFSRYKEGARDGYLEGYADGDCGYPPKIA